MTTLSIRLPRSIHNAIKTFAANDEISMNQFISSAVAEKIAAMEAENYIKERGKRGSLGHFKEMLSKVPEE